MTKSITLAYEVGEDDPLEYPKMLDIFMNKTYAFRIKVQPKYKQASVLGYRSDVDTISKVKDQFPGNENTFKVENNQLPVDNQTTSADPVETSYSSQELLVHLLPPSLSASAITSPACSSTITSKKRVLENGPNVNIATRDSAAEKKVYCSEVLAD